MGGPWEHQVKWNKPVTKDKCYTVPLIWSTLSSQNPRDTKYNSSYQELVGGME